MNRRLTTLALLSLAAPVLAQEETRQLDAHEHGVSTAEITVEDDRLVIDLYAPGMDIVGFEYEAESDEDRAAIAQAVMQLTRTEEIVTVDEAAGCLPIEVLSHLHDEDHEHEEAHAHMEGEEEHGDEEHGGEEHEGEEHAEEDGHEHGHDDEMAEGGDSHSEFHARYIYDCTDTSAIASIAFPFFDAFDNAEEIEAQYVTATGSGAGELERGGATLSLD